MQRRMQSLAVQLMYPLAALRNASHSRNLISFDKVLTSRTHLLHRRYVSSILGSTDLEVCSGARRPYLPRTPCLRSAEPFSHNTPSKKYTMDSSTSAGPVATSITSKLSNALHPTYLEVINESHMHNVPRGSETHFKVVVVAAEFEGLSLLKRHRTVNSLLQDELNSGVHALSINAKTPTQWEGERTASVLSMKRP